MSTFRVNKNVNYTVMSNHHLQDKRLSLKAKGLLSYMLSLPDDWDYSLKGLTTGCRDGIDSVRSAIHELEDGGYLCRSKVRDARGRIIDYNYEVFELPQKERIEKRPAPVPNSPSSENPMSGFPTLENPTQQNTNKQNTKRQSPEPPHTRRAASRPCRTCQCGTAGRGLRPAGPRRTGQ